jgi:hypothetical protein
MIFSGSNKGITHIGMILMGLPEFRANVDLGGEEPIIKTQTRRMSDRYYVGRDYAVQPGRGKAAVPDIRIKITKKWEEIRVYQLCEDHAKAEGGYTPAEYEERFAKMYPSWWTRWAYEFEVIKIG